MCTQWLQVPVRYASLGRLVMDERQTSTTALPSAGETSRRHVMEVRLDGLSATSQLMRDISSVSESVKRVTINIGKE